MKQRFRVRYDLYDIGEFIAYADSIRDVDNGFWVTVTGDFTKTSDGKYFILPHMVKRIDLHQQAESE